jgi:hypothetical protein
VSNNVSFKNYQINTVITQVIADHSQVLQNKASASRECQESVRIQSVRAHSDAGEPPALHMLPSIWLRE